jgi:hypothetical protein
VTVRAIARILLVLWLLVLVQLALVLCLLEQCVLLVGWLLILLTTVFVASGVAARDSIGVLAVSVGTVGVVAAFIGAIGCGGWLVVESDGVSYVAVGGAA